MAALLGFSADTPSRAPEQYLPVEQMDPSGFRIYRAVASHPALMSFYKARHYRPLWTKEAARVLMKQVSQAGEDGLNAQSLKIDLVRRIARSGDQGQLDVSLSQLFVDYVRNLRTPSAANAMIHIDGEAAPETRPDRLLRDAADVSSLADHVRAMRRMHPLYEKLRRALAADRGRAAAGESPAVRGQEQLILANMDRLRGLPADPGDRYIMVDTASARLWMVERGKIRGEMPVIVGREASPTPAMSGLIRFAVMNPYWNVPPDLARAHAAEVLRSGPQVLKRQRLELLSGWDKDARVLLPEEVDWNAVASGTRELRMRQTPGPDNMMGRVKFMMPNRYGIYLHDTPGKALFARQDRHLSSGCVRLSNAALLQKWLMRGQAVPDTDEVESRVNLPKPVPVYLLYLTAAPEGDRIVRREDVYGRDRKGSAAPLPA